MIDMRTEYVGLYLTEEMAKAVKEADDNTKLKDRLIKEFVTSETDWLNDEISDMDDTTLRYRAKLLTIKDSFSKAQDIYVEEIEELCNKTYVATKPINQHFDDLVEKADVIKDKISYVSSAIESLSNKIGYIDYSKIERLLDAMDRFNAMGESEKELIRLIIGKE